jgi:medium-chain acyl-[acyl-carrier-protein] hydrolase
MTCVLVVQCAPMNIPNPVWLEETRVKTYETDFQKRWKPACMLQTLIETATTHAGALGLGYQNLIDLNMAWVLSRIKIRFVKQAEMGQPVLIETWPKNIQQRLFFTRDFHLRTAQGETVALATSAWLLINPQARRMLPPQALAIEVPNQVGKSALDEPLDKINAPDGLPLRQTVVAGYSDIDLMNHTNSARYLEWVSDCFSMEEHRTHRLDWLQLNFVNETLPGESLAIHAGPGTNAPDTWFIYGTNLNTNLRAFEAALGWSNGL